MVSTDPRIPTTTDMSGLVQWPYGDESMAATNTVSITPEFGAPGSRSESTADITPGIPGPVLPEADGSERATVTGRAHDQVPGPLNAPPPAWTTRKTDLGDGGQRTHRAITCR